MTGNCHNTQKGITIVELLTVIAIVGIVLALPFLSMMGERKQKTVEVGQASVYQALSSARSRAVSGALDGPHGVCIRTNELIVYRKPGDCPDCATDCSGDTYELPPGVSASSSEKMIEFKRLTGIADGIGGYVDIEVFGFNATPTKVRVYRSGVIDMPRP